MKPRLAWILCAVVLVALACYLSFRGAGINWPNTRVRLGSRFLHHGMSEAAVRRLLGAPSEIAWEIVVSKPGRDGPFWSYTSPATSFTVYFNGSNGVAEWSWGVSQYPLRMTLPANAPRNGTVTNYINPPGL
jgi:hypothetical protein